MQDILDLDRRGIPAVALLTEEFRTGAEAWSSLHNYAPAVVYVRHPIQPLTEDELHARADEIFDNIMDALVA